MTLGVVYTYAHRPETLVTVMALLLGWIGAYWAAGGERSEPG